ncbi:IS630 family transposase [Rhodocytophaga rosea]|uniref:IS630 family transposase n=1 Tax=Rhodocytophaga rosea TaxID=2704465 RepID=A0A6C0GXD8_9BACT|nr:IS630 family transposase [Rhodocytophaga rosea]QHT72102.1 IS630 family transposase [Rhodocytophaga rosea]
MDYRWKRFRKWVKPLQNKQAYEQKRKALYTLLYLAQTGRIELYFGDESGFCLTPCVPYGWIKKGKHAPILSQKGARINVFGLLSTDNKLLTYQKGGSLNADFIIQCVDAFSASITKPTVIVLDNASLHTGGRWEIKKEEWEQKGLYIFFLPTYSPHLNRIERFWKQVKYYWLKAEDYLSIDALREALQTIFTGFENYFTLNFKELVVDENLILNFE